MLVPGVRINAVTAPMPELKSPTSLAGLQDLVKRTELETFPDKI